MLTRWLSAYSRFGDVTWLHLVQIYLCPEWRAEWPYNHLVEH